MSSADASNLATAMTDYSVSSATTDAAFDQKETTWTNEKWAQYLGYYKTIPELNSSIDAKATWTVGKGFKADELTTLALNKIKGWGKDTFNTILENMIRTSHIGGDAFAEIIRDKEGYPINLKPLDPASIMIVVDRKGIILRYEQISKVKTPNKKFRPDEIFHLARNRVADEIHGVSIIEKLEPIILMRNEAMSDWKRVLHRNVDPMMIYHLDTDDTTKIAAFKAKVDAAKGKGENMYIPKDAVVPEQLTTAGNSTLNPLPWIDALNQYFFQATGVPDIILGSSKAFTEASAKIAYLAFQQTIEEEQLFIEEQILLQLGMILELEFPASLENELLSDKKKDVEQGAAQPNDTTAGSGE
jgi:hypothetical protein